MHSSSNLVRTNSSNRILAKLLQNPIIRSSWAQHQSLAQGRLSVIIAPSHPTPLMQPQSLCAKSGERSHPPTPPHPTPPHVSVASTSCEGSRERSRRNVNIPPHPTPCERSSSILRKVEGMWPKERYNIPTPPHVIVASTSYARSTEVVEGTLTSPPHPAPPHVSVASASCEGSRERSRRNVHIHPHPTPCERSINILCKVEGTWPKEH